MRKKWIGGMVVFLLCLSLLAPAANSRAATESVRVTLPDFAVKLNGHTVENQYREYPLLVYNGITYFPMTWYDSRLLGLEAIWSQEEGLNIWQSPVTSSYFPTTSEYPNATSYMADIPATAITINHKTIDNTKEEYPLLSFRDVTYFPLTWRFAHDEFGWEYAWSDPGGLSITSHNPQLQTVGIPTNAVENDVVLFDGYYYFVELTDTTNHIYRAPIQQPSDKEEIYSYDYTTARGQQNQVTFQIRDNALWFTYYLGGATLGYSEFVKIGGNGKAELLYRGKINFRETPYGTLIINYGVPPRSGNLYLSPPGPEGGSRKAVGDAGLIYGFHVTYGNGIGLSAGPDGFSPIIIGDNVYVLASRGQPDPNKIYKINLKTGESRKIVNAEVSGFRVIDNLLYYVKDADNALYTSGLDGNGEVKLSDHSVSWFDSLDGNQFYTTMKEANRFDLYYANPYGEDTLVWSTPVTKAQVLNGRLVVQLSEADNSGVVLLDGSGGLLLSVADPISRVLTSDEGVLLKSARDSSVKFIR